MRHVSQTDILSQAEMDAIAERCREEAKYPLWVWGAYIAIFALVFAFMVST